VPPGVGGGVVTYGGTTTIGVEVLWVVLLQPAGGDATTSDGWRCCEPRLLVLPAGDQ
jgi:hypothetical protein